MSLKIITTSLFRLEHLKSIQIVFLSWYEYYTQYIKKRNTYIFADNLSKVKDILFKLAGHLDGLGAKWRYVGYFGSSLHPREEKFGCYHDSKACLGDLKSHVVLGYQWQLFCK